jgi:predicted O-methyltransferase YrrM
MEMCGSQDDSALESSGVPDFLHNSARYPWLMSQDHCRYCDTDLRQDVSPEYLNGGSFDPLVECPVCGASTGRVGNEADSTLSERMAPSDRLHQIEWVDDAHLQVGETHFFMTIDSESWESSESASDRFVLLKTKRCIETLLRMTPKQVDNIVDLGIYKGGSVALYQQLFSPKRIVGIDSLRNRVDALDQFVARRSLEDVVRLHYGSSQDDKELLVQVVRDDFGDEPLDIVIDDCSHMYQYCKTSLNVLLPRLRQGGLYVIEDWGWAHWPSEYWQGPSNPFADEGTPLSKLILELILVAASRPRLISEVTVQFAATYITRGDEVITDPDFDISHSYVTAGRQLLTNH